MTSIMVALKKFIKEHMIILPVTLVYVCMISIAAFYRSFDRYMSLFAGCLFITIFIMVLTHKLKSDVLFSVICLLLINVGLLYQGVLHSENGAGRLQLVYIIAFILAIFFALGMRIVVQKNSNRFLIKLLIGAILLLYLGLLIVGSKENGVRAWIHVGPLSIQITEITKLLSIITYALILADERSEKDKFRKGIMIYLINAIFLALYSELGTLIVLTFVFFLMMIMFLRVKYALGFLVYLAVLGFFGWVIIGYYGYSEDRGQFGELCHNIYEKIYLRFDLWINPTHYSRYNESHQYYAAMNAIRVAGFLGTRNYPLYNLPAVNTDYAFVGLVCKLGIVMGLVFVILYTVFFMQGLRTRETRIHTRLYMSLVAGMYVSAFLTILGSTGVIPIMGIGVPLLSYGGTSLCSGFFVIMMVLIERAKNHDLISKIDEKGDRLYAFFDKHKRLKRIDQMDDNNDNVNDSSLHNSEEEMREQIEEQMTVEPQMYTQSPEGEEGKKDLLTDAAPKGESVTEIISGENVEVKPLVQESASNEKVLNREPGQVADSDVAKDSRPDSERSTV